MGLDNSSVVKVCKGKCKHTGGYKFQYAPDLDLYGEIWVMNTHVGILVSNMGRVKSLVKTKGSKYESKEYYTVMINKKKYYVHRLVCQAFKWKEVQDKFALQEEYTDIDSFWKKLQVDHWDGNKTNNHIDNLQPLTSKEHAEKTNNNQQKSGKTRSRPIKGKKDGDWVRYSGLSQAARDLGDISFKSIQLCLKDKKTRKGYQFKFAPDPDLKDERWKDVPQKFFKNSVKGWRVSNMGRVHYKTHGVKYDGTDLGKYRAFGKQILVHRAVAAAFMEDKIMKVLRERNVII